MICPSKKKIFASLETVQQYLTFQKNQLPKYGRRAQPRYPYRCPHCRFYHLTSTAPTKDNPRYTAYKQEYKEEQKKRMASFKPTRLFEARRKFINALKRRLHVLRYPNDTQAAVAIARKRSGKTPKK